MSCDLSTYFPNTCILIVSLVHGGFTTELDTNTNNFSNVFKIQNLFLAFLLGQEKVVRRKKT
jgi:hypothetical protein